MNNPRRWIVNALKIAFGALLVVALFKGDYIDGEALILAFTEPAYFAPALILMFIGIIAGGFRWWLLLRIAGFPVELPAILRIQLMSGFFSIYMPGAAGGDVVRAMYVFKGMKKGQGRGAATLSIVSDRVFSLFGLLGAACLLSVYLVMSSDKGAKAASYIEGIEWIFIAACAAGIATLIAFGAARFFNLGRFLPARLVEYARILRQNASVYKTKWLELVFCAVISVAASALVALSIVLIAKIFPFSPDPLVAAVAGVLGNLFSAIPISPGGLGVGEVAFAKVVEELSGMVGPFATIYLTFRLGMFLVNIPGGLLALLSQHRDLLPAK